MSQKSFFHWWSLFLSFRFRLRRRQNSPHAAFCPEVPSKNNATGLLWKRSQAHRKNNFNQILNGRLRKRERKAGNSGQVWLWMICLQTVRDRSRRLRTEEVFAASLQGRGCARNSQIGCKKNEHKYFLWNLWKTCKNFDLPHLTLLSRGWDH